MTTMLLSICALGLSIASLIISFLSFMRDAAKVRAWCEVILHHGYPDFDSATPRLIIRVANLGRRPVVLLKLAVHGKSRRWFREIKEPHLPPMTNDNFREVMDQRLDHHLAQNASVRLLEGDVLDLAYWPNQATDFLFTEDGAMDAAKALFIVDFAGRKYRIKGDTSGIGKLLEAFTNRK